MSKTPLLALPILVLAACGDDPVQFSEPVGIELKAKSGDVVNSTVDANKGITTESGNPYGAFVTEAKAKLGKDPSSIEVDKVTLTLSKFVADAMAKLGGAQPSSIEVDKVTLTLGAQSTNVSALEQVVTGDVYVQFLTNDTNNTFVVAHFASPTGPGPVEGHTSFDWSQVGTPDVDKMLGGSFKVVLRGPAATGFETKGAEASLQLTFTFTAFE
jgi:hypothetical protein